MRPFSSAGRVAQDMAQEFMLHPHAQHPAAQHQALDLALLDHGGADQAMIAETVFDMDGQNPRRGSRASASSSPAEKRAPLVLNWVVRWNNSDTRSASLGAQRRDMDFQLQRGQEIRLADTVRPLPPGGQVAPWWFRCGARLPP